MIKILIAVVLLSVCFFSCKKKGDTIYPVITILSPTLNQSYNVYDTAHLNIKVSDETKLVDLRVVLQDMNNSSVLNSISVSIQSNSFQFQLAYILGDIHLNTGNYNLTVFASDGFNTQITAKTIYIVGVPIEKKYFYFAAEVGNTTTITRVDSVLLNAQLINFNGKFVAMKSSSWYQKLFVAGEVNADFNCYGVLNNQLYWHISDMGAGFPYFSSLATNDRNVLVGFMDGRLQQIDNNGNIAVNYQTGVTSYYPTFEFVLDGDCYAGMKDKLSSSRNFIRFNASNGNQIFQSAVNWLPVAMGKKSANEVYIAANTNTNQAVLNVYTTTTNSFYSPQNLPTGSILCGALVDNDYFIIAHSNGNIYRYQYSTNSLISIYTAITPTKMIYNFDFNELYVSAGTNFFIFNVAPYALQLKQSFINSGSIDDFEVVFNK